MLIVPIVLAFILFWVLIYHIYGIHTMPIEAHEALDDQLLLRDYAYQAAKVGKKL